MKPRKLPLYALFCNKLQGTVWKRKEICNSLTYQMISLPLYTRFASRIKNKADIPNSNCCLDLLFGQNIFQSNLLFTIYGQHQPLTSFVSNLLMCCHLLQVPVSVGNCHGFVGNRMLGMYSQEVGSHRQKYFIQSTSER